MEAAETDQGLAHMKHTPLETSMPTRLSIWWLGSSKGLFFVLDDTEQN